ncbi:FadR/GntR family transcriptional regulator [Salinisphaera aquimarina]|uniref:FadR/GntR family transcriptional regulator n=1 Tax=Salinisphaera aquimarina TaxID=2094031 RepID=A0ABV7EMC3_9GAMM
MTLARIPRGSLVESVIDHLRRIIASGEWPVGDRIPVESILAERMGVGRNTVREAVRVLVHAGMLDTRQGDGTYVRAQLDPAQTLRRIDRAGLRDRIEVRLTLEVEAARLAAGRRNETDIADMRRALQARADAGDALEARIAHDARFHQAVVAAAHNSALMELYRHFAGAIRNTIERTETDIDLPEPSQADHERLLNAIRTGDQPGAADAARALLTPALDALTADQPHA